MPRRVETTSILNSRFCHERCFASIHAPRDAKGTVENITKAISAGCWIPRTWIKTREARVEKRLSGGMKVPMGMISSQKSSKKKAVLRLITHEPVHKAQKKAMARGRATRLILMQKRKSEKKAKKNYWPPKPRGKKKGGLPCCHLNRFIGNTTKI